MEESAYLSEKLGLDRGAVERTLKLFEDGATVPFVARYRREETGNMSDETLRKLLALQESYRAIEERRKTILASLEKQGVEDPGVIGAVKAAQTLSALEDIYLPYKPKRETRGSKAVKAGLKPLLDYIFSDRTRGVKEYAQRFVCEAYPDAEKCIQGALDIWAEKMSERASSRRNIRELIQRRGRICPKLLSDAPDHNFDQYGSMSFSLATVKPYQVLAINRGVRMKCLRLSFDIPESEAIEMVIRVERPAGFIYAALLEKTAQDACQRLIFPSVENEVWNGLLDKAKEESTEVFAKGVKDVLLAPPLKPQPVLGFDPGIAHGCKLAVIDASGKVLDSGVVYATSHSENDVKRAERIVAALLTKYSVHIVALGDGTASRESREFLERVFRENGIECQIALVSEAGASVYSVTERAKEEFPEYDVNLRSAISIARRLLDPMAELVKIPPESLGVGQYQHDLDQKVLSKRLSAVVEDCVSSVGVDLNTASSDLLEHVSGLNRTTARNLVAYRDANGAFTSRQQLWSVKGFGPKTFANAAGFLRIHGDDPLDDTFIHPESYEIARKAIGLLNIQGQKNAGEKLANMTAEKLEEACRALNTDQFTLRQILEELAVPHRDPRGEFRMPRFDSSVRTIQDLREGMVLEGKVNNVVDYGAYVDIGIHKDGLVHISQMPIARGVKPQSYLKIGQVVRVLVSGVDIERNRISLSMRNLPKEDGR